MSDAAAAPKEQKTVPKGRIHMLDEALQFYLWYSTILFLLSAIFSAGAGE